LEVPQILERLQRDARQYFEPLPAARTDHAARRKRKELVFRQNLASAIRALEQLRAETHCIQKAHFIIADRQPRIGFFFDAVERFH
jgi:hypothetical protein